MIKLSFDNYDKEVYEINYLSISELCLNIEGLNKRVLYSAMYTYQNDKSIKPYNSEEMKFVCKTTEVIDSYIKQMNATLSVYAKIWDYDTMKSFDDLKKEWSKENKITVGVAARFDKFTENIKSLKQTFLNQLLK